MTSKKNTYAIMDRGRLGQWPNELPVVPLVRRELCGQPQEQPLLLLLDEVNNDQKSELVEDNLDRSRNNRIPWFETMLESELDVQSMARHLIDKLIFYDNDKHAYLLRYYDPLVFIQLTWMVSGHKFRQLFGGIIFNSIATWQVLDKGVWLKVDSPSLQLLKKLPPVNNREVSARLKKIGVINIALNDLPSLAFSDRPKLGQEAWALICRAESLFGLNDDYDLAAFAFRGLTVHPKFYSHQMIRRIIAEKKSFFRASSCLADQEWQTIKNDVESKTILAYKGGAL